MGRRLRRERQEILLTAGYFGVMEPISRPEQAEAVADIGAALILHLRLHPP